MAAPKGNKYAYAKAKFKDPDKLSQLIDDYFDSCYADRIVRDKDGHLVMDKDNKPVYERAMVEPPTMTGLALFLDCDIDTIRNYAGVRVPESIDSVGMDKDIQHKYFAAIKRARLRCERFAETQLFTARNPAGSIFNLKNNYGWRDKTEQEVTVVGLGDALAALAKEPE